MRVFIAVIVLFFSLQSWTKADDISDLQIEGISIGDSALDHFSKKKIIIAIENATYYLASKKFAITKLNPDYMNEYDRLNITINPNDKKFIIYSIRGVTYMPIQECLEKKKKILEDISEITIGSKTNNYKSDYNKKYGNSYAMVNDYHLKGGLIRVWCETWDKENKNVSNNSTDSLAITISSKEFYNWLQTEAF